MATTAITCPLLALNTVGADNGDAGNGTNTLNGIVATTPSDGWVVSPPSGQEFANDRIVFRLSADGSGDTYTFLAGDRYPAQRADLGNLAAVCAASDSRMIVVETSRFVQNDGTILVTCTDAGSLLSAFMLPKGA